MDQVHQQTAYEKVEAKYHDGHEVSVYDEKRFGAPGGRFLNEVQVATVLEFVGDAPKSVLEVGCGTGRFTFALAGAGHKVRAVDYSAAMLDTCRERQQQEQHGKDIEFSEASIFELPFEDDSFDAVVCIHVLMHLPEHAEAVRELIRVVKPGGRVIFDIRNTTSLNRISYPFRRLMQRVQGRDPWYVWYTTPQGLAQLVMPMRGRVTRVRGLFPFKPNKVGSAGMGLIKAMESGDDNAWIRRFGHIQMMQVTKEANAGQ